MEVVDDRNLKEQCNFPGLFTEFRDFLTIWIKAFSSKLILNLTELSVKTLLCFYVTEAREIRYSLILP